MEPARSNNVSPLKRDDDALSLRSPPHNFEAEVQLLGAILSNNRAFDRVIDFLRPEHFADDRHARIFEACSKLIGRGQLASATTTNAMISATPRARFIPAPRRVAATCRNRRSRW